MLRNLQGVLWNALFCAYLLLAAPHVLAGVRGASAEGRVNPAFGVVLLGFLLLETAGFHVKIRALYARLGEARGRFQRPVLLYTAWMAHLLITTFLFMETLDALGLDLKRAPVAGPVGLVAWICKELYLLGFLLVARGRRAVAPAMEWGADLVLFLFSCVAYTGFLQTFTDDIALSDPRPAMAVVKHGCFSLLFALFYAGVQTPSFVERCFPETAPGAFRAWAWSLLGVLAAANLA